MDRAKKYKGSCREVLARISEAQTKDGRISYPVVIISQGLGNLSDKNYYTAEAIQQAAAEGIYEGKKAYFDHPTPTEEEEQPGRSVLDTCGHYEDVKAEQDDLGLFVLKALFVPEPGSQIIPKIDHAVLYKKKYPDLNYIGISINGDGEGKTMPYEDFIKEVAPKAVELEKLQQIEGQDINVITKFTSAVSADVVTEAGARGRYLLESKQNFKKRREKMFELMSRFFKGIETGNKKMVEDASEAMSKEADTEKKEATEALAKEAGSMAAEYEKAKKETKKEADESEEAYQAKCMQSAMAAMKKTEADAAATTDDEEKPEDKKNPEDDKQEAAPAPEKKDEEKPAAEGDLAGLKKEMEAMKTEIAALKSGKKEADAEKEKHQESAVNAKIKAETYERAQEIDTELRESDLPRWVTDELRPLLAQTPAKAKRKTMLEAAKKVHVESVRRTFFSEQTRGFTEVDAGTKPTSNDDLFN